MWYKTPVAASYEAKKLLGELQPLENQSDGPSHRKNLGKTNVH